MSDPCPGATTAASLARVIAALETHKLLFVMDDGSFYLTNLGRVITEELMNHMDLRGEYRALIQDGVSAPTARLATLISGALLALSQPMPLGLTSDTGGAS